MGFSSALQGPASHDAILLRIDAELRLLENMRRCVGIRIKSDREYAISLNSFVLQAQKMESVELCGSHVAKAWSVFIDETEKISKLVKENAEFLATETTDKLTTLYTEKKANRKLIQEEYLRIWNELHRLQEQVHKTRNDYERCLDSYAVSKSKYEEQYVKSKSGKRLDDCRERYQKACRKLHHIHNEYVLLLCEASEFERDMRTILLPGLLEHQQAVQEDMIDKWKLILQDIQKSCNHASSRCQEMQVRVEESVNAVKAADEYKKFTDINKTTPPAPVVFKFDESLLAGYESTKLTPGNVTLDDLTIDSLKQKMQEIDMKLQDCRSKIKEKQTYIIQYETELQTVKFKSDSLSVNRMFAVKKKMDSLKKEVNELRCVEQKLSRQNEMIRTPINDLGCEQAPSGCEVEKSEEFASLSGGSAGELNVSPIKAPKRGIPAQISTAGGAVSNWAPLSRLKNSFSNSAISVNQPASGNGIGGVSGLKNKLGTSLISSSRQDFSGSNSEFSPAKEFNASNTHNESNKKDPPDHAFNVQSTTSEMSNRNSTNAPVSHNDTIVSNELEGAITESTINAENAIDNENDDDDDPNSAMEFVRGRPLDEELWFHGVLPRGEVVRLLETDGDFLVRETVRNDEKQIVLSVMWSSPKHFIVQTSPEGLFRFEGPAFDSVQELIIHQFQSGLPVTSRSGAILKTTVVREKWELNNDDIELVDKIGRGNFGDVYRANLHVKGIKHPHTKGRGKNILSVAAKTCKVTLPEEQKKKFLQEGRILKQYDHPNIVKFIGICVQKQPIMIVMELVSGGSLLSFLRNNGTSLTSKNLLGMCLDAAAGMKYLETMNCIHRDLAARNCLVGEGNVVKISDFGMSREEEEYTVSDGLKQIPIKWTAPEALNYGKYTSLCDVWSFGVLCWEIFSKGGTPYQGMTNTRAREMLDSGYRMPSPDGAPEEMYQLMLRCWQYEPEDRSPFNEIHSTIDLLYSRFSVGPETRV